MEDILEKQLADLRAMFAEADTEQKLEIANVICKTASLLMQFKQGA